MEQLEKILTVDTIRKDTETWRLISELLMDRLEEVDKLNAGKTIRKLERIVKKEKKLLKRQYIDTCSYEWFNLLCDPSNWKEVDYYMDNKWKCAEEICKKYYGRCR